MTYVRVVLLLHEIFNLNIRWRGVANLTPVSLPAEKIPSGAAWLRG